MKSEKILDSRIGYRINLLQQCDARIRNIERQKREIAKELRFLRKLKTAK